MLVFSVFSLSLLLLNELYDLKFLCVCDDDNCFLFSFFSFFNRIVEAENQFFSLLKVYSFVWWNEYDLVRHGYFFLCVCVFYLFG